MRAAYGSGYDRAGRQTNWGESFIGILVPKRDAPGHGWPLAPGASLTPITGLFPVTGSRDGQDIAWGGPPGTAFSRAISPDLSFEVAVPEVLFADNSSWRDDSLGPEQRPKAGR